MTTRAELVEVIHRVDSRLGMIESTLNGNGDEGLIKRVNKNSTHRITVESRNKLMMSAVGSGWLVTLLLALLAIKGVI